ncbi:MAG: acyl-phosphate glycerol 3-phosphate acyltransferase [Gammaproteobacteria bacterium]|nr:MAG: acyl-phosphate glycerol 3-phosphate acyltransferase [Gammaproteobacteria bacterium]
MTDFILFLLIGYLMGSLSSAIIVCKLMGLPDPRTQGSKNPGATNVMRIGGKKAAYATFIGDFLKGLLPVLIAAFVAGRGDAATVNLTDAAHFYPSSDIAIAGAALGAFLGHLYPLYFGFKGGKGVATLVGVLLGISPWIFISFGAVWLVLLFTTGYVSLASMVGAVVAAITALLLGFAKALVGVLMVLAVLVIYRHRDNIHKLLNGTENHFRKKKE